MSYLLSNPSTQLLQALSRESWSRILSLARFYGWQPMGTLPPFIHKLRGLANESGAHAAGNSGVWDGTYLRNEGQLVQATDALAMAIALEMSLDDIPDVNPERDLALEDELPEWLSPSERALIRDGLVDHLYNVSGILPFQYFAGDAKQNLIEFIRFCMLGEFVIS